MSIATRTGDNGTTGLMYNRRVSKCHPRVEAYGTVDELNTALGLARAITAHPFIRESLLPIQKDLVTVMGELATAVDDLPRYVADGYPTAGSGLTEKLDQLVATLEAQDITYKGWATPGATPDAAALDIAPAECLVIEDSVNGVLAARAAGMRCWGFLGGGHAHDGLAVRLTGAGAEHLVTDWPEAARLLPTAF